MCLSTRPASSTYSPSTAIMSLGTISRKRTIVQSNTNDSSSCARPQRKKVKPSTKKAKKSVGFSSNVSMRCFAVPDDQQQQQSPASSTWMSKDEIDTSKRRAKFCARLHLHLQSQHRVNPTSVTIGDAARYEVSGESLRGMEYATSTTHGHKRRRAQGEAIKAVESEQREQLVQRVLDCTSSPTAAASAGGSATQDLLKIDTASLARAYGSKTTYSLEYAKSVAEEDALVAAEILAQDMDCTSEATDVVVASEKQVTKEQVSDGSVDPQVAAEIIESLLQHTFVCRRRNLVSAQA